MGDPKRFRIYNQHKGGNIFLTLDEDIDLSKALDETRGMADAAAKLGHDAFYRLFGPEGFVMAFSVLGGVVHHHAKSTTPDAHW